MLKEDIKKIARDIFPTVVEDRRHLHANPELSFQEIQPAKFIKARLDEMTISWITMAETGVVAIIEGARPSNNVVALRADIDALPIAEKNQVGYRSNHEGIMHACGHDAHTASLLGTAFILQSLKSKYGGTIKLIFQPGEERLPGGASLMIKEGVLQNPTCGAVIGQHVMPSIETGKIGIRPGKFMASMDELYVTVKGKGGHGAMPQNNIDPVLITCHIIIALQQIVSRMAHPIVPTVLSFGKLIANGTINVIPDDVYIEGTFRTMDEEGRVKTHVQMKKMASAIAESMGATCEFKIVRGYPCLINEDLLTAQVRSFAQEYLGEENVLEASSLTAAEDFAYYSQVTDSCLYLLGTGNTDDRPTSSLHSATFNIDESSLALSTGLMAFIALKRLGN